MLTDAKGNRIYRRIDIKIVFPDKILPDRKMSQRAEPHKGISPDGIDDLLMQTADQLDTLYPWWQFRVVELAPVGRTAKYVFTFAGNRAMPLPDTSRHQGETSAQGAVPDAS